MKQKEVIKEMILKGLQAQCNNLVQHEIEIELVETEVKLIKQEQQIGESIPNIDLDLSRSIQEEEEEKAGWESPVV